MDFLYLLMGAPKGPDSSVKPLFRRRDAHPLATFALRKLLTTFVGEPDRYAAGAFLVPRQYAVAGSFIQWLSGIVIMIVLALVALLMLWLKTK
jgi:hypothetical protein